MRFIGLNKRAPPVPYGAVLVYGRALDSQELPWYTPSTLDEMNVGRELSALDSRELPWYTGARLEHENSFSGGFLLWWACIERVKYKGQRGCICF